MNLASKVFNTFTLSRATKLATAGQISMITKL